MKRRTLLVTGAAAIVIAGGGWMLTRAPKKARAPWREAGEGFGDPRLDALAYAILAPNPHNMQPWRVRLHDDGQFTVYCDQTRLLPETDPPNRQITIGFGCFLELLRQAAAEKGYRADITDFPDGEPEPLLDERPIAHVMLIKDETVARDPLFGETLIRRTNRAPFAVDRSVPTEVLASIKEAAGDNVIADAIDGQSLVEDLRKLTIDAWHAEWSTPQTRRESVIVTRIGKQEINDEPWGLALLGAPVEALAATGLISREKMGTPGSTAYDESLKFYDRACETAMAYAVIKTATNTRRDQLDAGRAWVRMQLAATAAGVGFHPLSQALQEFPEMTSHYERAHELLGATNGETVQMLSRLGYAKDAPPSPREPLMSKLVSS